MSEIDDLMRNVCKKRKSESLLLDQRYNELSKKRLLRILEKKITTAFISGISNFEKAFGYLWGSGKSEKDLTEDEARFRFIWNQVRSEILNTGNAQIRAVQNEISLYTIKWNRYNYNFKIGE